MRLMKARLAVVLLLVAGAVGTVGGDQQTAGGGERHLIKVPSRCDGVLLVIGTEIKEGEKVPPDQVVTVKVGDEEKKYRRLRAGDAVEEGQLLARLDDRLAREELAEAKQKVVASQADWDAAKKTRDEAEQRYRTMERLIRGKGDMSLEEVRAAKLTWDRYFYEEIARKAAVEVARLEGKLAQTRLQMYEIRSPVSGTVTKLY